MSNNITTINEEIYKRQEFLEGFSNDSAIVIGLGGIGSWLAMDLALIGVGTLIIIDPDIIEASNLNRTMFKLSDIGKKKTTAIEELIKERRQDIIIVSIEDYFNQRHLEKYEVDYIFDCTDNLSTRKLIEDYKNKSKQLAEESKNTDNNVSNDNNNNNQINFIPGIPTISKQATEFNTPYCKCGYDGFFGTILMNEFERGKWGDDGSYTVVPSLFATPQILATIAIIEVLINGSDQNLCINLNIKNLLKNFKETKPTNE
ncbi:MAG TPA: ThiF family adenylyltransferase [Ignavibacteria bacterium]|nr:ThiF family adenylyltransferase [Ignavibacteria bacterium]